MTGRKQATCCALVLLFSFFSIGASSYNGQTCLGDKPVANSTFCTSTSEPVNASECQAAESYPLRLVCSACSEGITWQRWNGFKWETIAGTHNQQILEYTAEEVVPSLAGCYRCWCYRPPPQGGYTSVFFSVDVQAPESPKLLMPNAPEEHEEFILGPVTVNLVVNQQMVCFPFTSTGYPDVAIVVFLVPFAICFAVLCGYYKRRRKGHAEGRLARPVLNEEDVQQAERQPPLNKASQPMVSYDAMEPHNQSVSIIACPVPGTEETVSQWKLRSDGKLELPRPVPGADYFMKVRSSDGYSIRIPIGGAVCTPEEVPPLPAEVQSPSEVAQSLPPVVQSTLVVLQPPPKEVQPEQSPWPIEAESPSTANSILPNTAVQQIADSSPYKPHYVRKLSFQPPDSSPSLSKNPLPSHSTPSDCSRHSSSPLSPASPSTPKLYLTEGPDQTPRAAEISWSVDAMKKTTGVISVKRGTTYRLEVPPQRETVILKIKTFGKRRLTDPLPSDIDEAVPVTVRHLNEFSTRLAPYWDRIGHGIGVKIVQQLRDKHDDSRKMTLVFESWVEDAPKWKDLLLVLENTLQLTAISSNIRDYLHEEYSNVNGGGRQGASPFDND